MGSTIKSVYLCGDSHGSYRAQNIFKAIADSGVPFAALPRRYIVKHEKVSLAKRILRYTFDLATFPLRLVLIAFASHFVVLPMNYGPRVLAELLAARLMRKPIVVDYYVSKYDTEVNDRGRYPPKGFVAWRLRQADRLLMASASIVLFLNRAEAGYYQGVVDVRLAGHKCRVVPLCVDYNEQMFAAPNCNHVASDEGYFNICWWGTYVPLHGLEVILRGIKMVESAEVRLFLFGDSDRKAEPYVALVKELQLESIVTIRNDLHFRDGSLPRFLNEKCHLSLGTFGHSNKAKTVLANKIVDSVALGIPCLTSPTSATRELFGPHDGLIYCESTAESLAAKILTLTTDRQSLRQMGRQGVKRYLEVFSPEAFRRSFIAALVDAGGDDLTKGP